ncbi:MAG: hypothetical protein H0T71_13175 [Acidobacteria bacterium]|nr:hypothetical protein [Acidobacteriota bacterium]
MKGFALVLALLVLSVCSAFAATLMLVTLPERVAAGSYRDSVAALNAADAAIELAAREMRSIADWNTVLSGTTRSRLVDGAPSGLRAIARGEDIDLAKITNELTCGSATVCSDARLRLRTAERPWGSNNPRWRLFIYTPLAAVRATPEFSDRYVVVWVGDDGSESDGNPLVDGGAPSGAGAAIVRVRAESFGPGPTRRAIEADLVRRDSIRVQSWRTVSPAVP